MKLQKALVALSFSALALLTVSASGDTLSDYLTSQGMVKVPTSLQNKILPGTLLIVRFHHTWRGWKPSGTQVYRTRIDVDEPTFHGDAVAGEKIDNTAFRGSAGVVLGLLAPSAALITTNNVNYAGTEFATTEWDAGDIDELLERSKLTQGVIDKFILPGSDPKVVDDTYQIFVVESVFAASSVHLTSTSNQQLMLKNNTPLTTCDAKANPIPNHEQPGAPGPVPADRGTGVGQGAATPPPGAVGAEGAGAKPPADPHPDSPKNGVPYYPVHLELCSDQGHSYYLNHTPPVPLGMRVMQIKYVSGVLDADVPLDPRDVVNIQ